MTVETNHILEELEKKFDAINQKTDTHLEGLLWSKPITYWDYIQTDALLIYKLKEPFCQTKWFLLCIIRSMSYCLRWFYGK